MPGKRYIKNIGQNKCSIHFPYDYITIANIKQMVYGRQWDKKNKYWTAPITPANITVLEKLKFEIPYAIKKQSEHKAIEVKIKLPRIKRKLFPFQMEGVQFLENNNGRGLIGDDMGLGKTIQALAYLELHPKERPVIIVTPATLKLNWELEIQKTLSNPGKVEILKGKKPYIFKADIIIINYDILVNWVDKLITMKPAILITDEAQYYKNNKSKRTKAVLKFAKKVPKFIALSGTPITSRPIEFYNVLSLCDNTLFPNRWYYAMRFCDAKQNGYGWDFSGASNIKELHDMVAGKVMIRRRKGDVYKQLPDKTWNYIPIEIDNWEEYQSAKTSFISWLKENVGVKQARRAVNAEAIVQVNYLKQLAAKGKLKQVRGWINDFLEGTDQKLVVFAVHKFVIDFLMDQYADLAVKVDGSLTGDKKQGAVKQFQENDNIRLFIGNIQAAGVGITLTRASNVAFIELPWTPGELVQAEDRCHRIGQKNAVTIHYLIAKDTIDNDMVKLLDKKRKVIAQIIDGIEVVDNDLLQNLISSYLK